MLFAYRRQPQGQLDPVCISCTRPERDGRLIVFTRYWKALLHPNQSSLGSVLIVSLRHVPKVGALTRPEMADFHGLFSRLEAGLESRFGAALVNLSCERNWAYREQNPDPPFLAGKPNPHVHWHVVPRYRKTVRFMGLEWVDPTFGEPFRWRKKAIPDEVTLEIIQSIRRALPVKYAKRPSPSPSDAGQRRNSVTTR